MKQNLVRNKVTRFALICVCATFVSTAVRGQIIGLNITQYATDVQQINGTETYGVPSLGTVVGGWNNFNQAVSGINLSYSDASSSTVGFSLTAPGGWNSAPTNVNNTPLKGFLADYTTTVNPTTLTVNNLNANFSGGYYLIVYLSGFNGNNGASISDGTSTYYYQPVDFSSSSWDGTLVQTTTTTDNGDGAAPVAQYALFGSSVSPLSSDSVTLTLNTLYGGGSGIGGLQIIGAPAPVPEPSAMALALMGGVGLMAFRRRQLRN